MKPTEISIVEFLSRLGMAALLGIAIGFERQWRQRSAGLHTSSLVAIGAALFALLDTTMGTADTTRIVAGVVTGVGFIAGGVILKSGPNITGLNTAATMWATAAVGALAGFGLWREAGAGAIGVILVNILLLPVADAIDARAKGLQFRETAYEISIACSRDGQNAVSEALLKAVSGAPVSLQSLTRQHAEGGELQFIADILSSRPNDALIESISSALLATPGVRRADWQKTNA